MYVKNKNGSDTTPIHITPSPTLYFILTFAQSNFNLMRGKLLPLLCHNSTIQSASLSTCAQKWLRPFALVRNTRVPVCCSMWHMCSLCIMFANLFFALREIGVTNAVCMISMRLYVCNLGALRISTRLCVPLVRLSRDLDEIISTRFNLYFLRNYQKKEWIPNQ